ncbi:unnamed protein product [Rotaria socialis]|uniref:Uncharacterized protein n=1 Tax=Rotaria socialis TaxID=392032 RepID=A0A820G982_9BILA|nr:unnamed protein product [Rotaria socialis]CAF3434940.1 unnamed protein product [Rotaria socialis]CAF3712216.1 unnamed protein product [Rotaria socialis]CAF4166092.1 unnamed protein product [Rotaria socialis]CAF4275654.1 unnamed protein product [Rotaria socialis]
MITIAQPNASISDLQIQLGICWAQNAPEAIVELTTNLISEKTGLATTTTTTQTSCLTMAPPNTTTVVASTFTKGQACDSVEHLEEYILDYIQYYTQLGMCSVGINTEKLTTEHTDFTNYAGNTD